MVLFHSRCIGCAFFLIHVESALTTCSRLMYSTASHSLHTSTVLLLLE